MFALLFINYTENFASWFVLTYFTALLFLLCTTCCFLLYLLLFNSFTIYYLFFRNQIELFSHFLLQCFFYCCTGKKTFVVFSVVCHFVLPLLQRWWRSERHRKNLPLSFVFLCVWVRGKAKVAIGDEGLTNGWFGLKILGKFLFVFGKKGFTSISVWYVGGLWYRVLNFLRVEKLHYLPTCFSICIVVLLSLEIVWYN